MFTRGYPISSVSQFGAIRPIPTGEVCRWSSSPGGPGVWSAWRCGATGTDGTDRQRCWRLHGDSIRQKEAVDGRDVVPTSIWLVVWNVFIHFLFFPYIGNKHPKWRTHIFQRGRYTTNQVWKTPQPLEFQRPKSTGGLAPRCLDRPDTVYPLVMSK